MLTSPPTCGPEHDRSATSTPTPAPPRRSRPASFTLTKAPGGGACAKTLAARPFTPGLLDQREKRQVAGAFSPFAIHVARTDGQQELKGVDVTLPPGISGKLEGHPLLLRRKRSPQPPAAPGAAEAKNASCPDKSLVGVATISAGSRHLADPDQGQGLPRRPLQGRAALAGGDHPGRRRALRPRHRRGPGGALRRPRNGPDPRRLGPDPRRLRRRQARASARSTSTPTRRTSSINPTSCGKLATDGVDPRRRRRPDQPGGLQLLRRSSRRFQTTDCGSAQVPPQALHPGLRRPQERPSGRRTRNSARPSIARDGDANLRPRRGHPAEGADPRPEPHQERSAPGRSWPPAPARRARSTATRRRPRRCSASSCSGPVYLVPGNHILPDLLVDLHGQVDIRLRGTTESVKSGRLRNIFYSPPTSRSASSC